METVPCCARERTPKPTNIYFKFVDSWRLYHALYEKDSAADEHSLRVCHIICVSTCMSWKRNKSLLSNNYLVNVYTLSVKTTIIPINTVLYTKPKLECINVITSTDIIFVFTSKSSFVLVETKNMWRQNITYNHKDIIFIDTINIYLHNLY